MTRTPTSRLGTALAGLVFTATAGVTGMEAHPLSAHGPHSGEVIATEVGSHAGHTTAHGAGHHAGYPGHGSPGDCTCVGLCPGAAHAPLRDGDAAPDRFDGPGLVVKERPSTTVVLQRDPRSRLLPFPNGPPARA